MWGLYTVFFGHCLIVVLYFKIIAYFFSIQERSFLPFDSLDILTNIFFFYKILHTFLVGDIGFVRRSIGPSTWVENERKEALVYVCVWGGVFGVDGGWMPLPTAPLVTNTALTLLFFYTLDFPHSFLHSSIPLFLKTFIPKTNSYS